MYEEPTHKIDPRFPAEVYPLPARSSRKTQESIGQRLARLRRDRGLTQEELAEMLGVAQPMISGYERDQFRLNGDVIIELTRILGVSADEILGLKDIEPAAAAKVRNKRLLRKLEELERLPRRDQEALLRTINAFLQKAG
jgi:transcriptional regulator with XRE-family HTH domain